MKDSYRISKLLKRISGIKFIKSHQSAEVSDQGKQQSDTYYQTHQKPPVIKEPEAVQVPSQEKYVQYQKEVEAAKLLNKPVGVKQPGKILKLPVDRKEINPFEDT